MTEKTIRQILKDTAYIRTGGSQEEQRAANYLQCLCEQMGAKAWQESFPIEMGEIKAASLRADGKEIPCKGYRLCGSGRVEAPLCYLPNTDPASLTGVGGKIVMLDTGVTYFTYQDLLKNGAVGFITYDGNVHYRDRDIDQKELRPYVSMGEKIPGVNINAKDAAALIKSGAKTAVISVEQEEWEGESRNVVAELPGSTDEWILLTAHYDSTSLSMGSYDNMSGCVGLLYILEEMRRTAPHRYGLRFLFCGSEERGLRGSKAYAAAHEAELAQIALNINLDMIGSVMGKFIACVSAEEALLTYIRYYASMTGFGISARLGVYSSDSTPLADKGVPAVSFARIAPHSQATIHNRYDTAERLSARRIKEDCAFLTAFTRTMADAVKCPVSRDIPDKVKNELDEYLNRKRKQ